MKIIILAGGLGRRLWPLINPPKQFSYLLGPETLFQKTVHRFLKGYAAEDIVIVTNRHFYKYATAQAPALRHKVIVEPESKNTAFALLYALEWLKEQDELDDEFLVVPSDHLIEPEELLLNAIELGRERAVGHLLFGIQATEPNPHYGYIIADFNNSLPQVQRFIEKPDLSRATELFQTENCLWNSGIFLFQTEQFFKDLGSLTLHNIPALSIDKAFLEHFSNLSVLPINVTWSDLGSWESVYTALGKDEEGNVIRGDVTAPHTKNSLIIALNGPLHIEEVENMCIVKTEEGLLVRQRSKELSMLFSSSCPSPQ